MSGTATVRKANSGLKRYHERMREQRRRQLAESRANAKLPLAACVFFRMFCARCGQYDVAERPPVEIHGIPCPPLNCAHCGRRVDVQTWAKGMTTRPLPWVTDTRDVTGSAVRARIPQKYSEELPM